MDTGRPQGDDLDPQASAPVQPTPPPAPPAASPPPPPPPQASAMPPGWSQLPHPAAQPAVHSVLVPMPGAVAYEGALLVPAGFWPRVLAFLIDMFVLAMLKQMFTLIVGYHAPDQAEVTSAMNHFFRSMDFNSLERIGSMGPPSWFNFLLYVICGAYYTLFHYFSGATLGKMALGLQVRQHTGAPISFAQSLGRYFGFLVTQFLLYTSWMIGIDREKRTAYDAVLRLNVFRTISRPPGPYPS